MNIAKVPMTSQGYQRLQEELKQLKSVERPSIIQAIAEARAHGDLSENAEYHSARERQGFIEARIADLEAKLAYADVIDVTKLNGNHVKFGAKVTVYDEEHDNEKTYQIVGEEEADIKKGLISFASPLARALISKEVGDEVEVRTPNGTHSYEILKIYYEN